MFDMVEKLHGAVFWNVGRCSNEEPLCQFIGNSSYPFSNKREDSDCN